MIILNLKDGLGNQLFEYAFARYLQEKCGEKIRINNFFFLRSGGQRHCSLQHFILRSDTSIMDKRKEPFVSLWFLIRMFFSCPIVFLRVAVKSKDLIHDADFQTLSKKGLYITSNPFRALRIPPLPKCFRNKYVFGNFENFAYVAPNIEKLRDELQIKTAASAENRNKREELLSCESVCVHVRRGDYLDPKWAWLNVCSFDYYQKAMDHVQKLHPDAKFYIFSNTHGDIEWIKENYHFKQAVSYIDFDNPDYEELRLMEACNHFIISSSTFSWWAAVLASREGKTVVAPGVWSRQDSYEDYKGMYLPDWHLINTDAPEHSDEEKK